MLEFKRLDGTEPFLKEYFCLANAKICDLSVGVRYMWRNDFKVDYAFYNDTLILKENNENLKDGFYFPIGKDVLGALKEIENYALKNRKPLIFCYLDEEKTEFLSERYFKSVSEYDRNWSDYIYDAESFKSFSGKKYGGQRNHINKFKKTYPTYVFRELKKEDICDMLLLLEEHKSTVEVWDDEKREEEKLTADFVKNAFSLGQKAGGIFFDGKLVGMSIGEIIGDTLIVHIEKALKNYEGIYPTLANTFANAFSGNAKYVNREEDCGEEGLRISKTQYHPIEIKNKYVLKAETEESAVAGIERFTAEDLTVARIQPEDSPEYFALYTDETVNKFYGYDYREDLKGEPTEKYFYDFQEFLQKSEGEYSFAVKRKDEFLGEIVVYDFKFDGSCAIGYRFFQKYWGTGVAVKTVTATVKKLKEVGLKTVRAWTKKKNERSFGLLEKTGFIKTREDDEFFYYETE